LIIAEKPRLCKAEVLVTGPNLRNICGVNIEFIEPDRVLITGDKGCEENLLIVMSYMIYDEPTEINKIVVNGLELRINKNIKEEQLFKEIKEMVNSAQISIELTGSESGIIYEMGCIIYPIYKNYPEDYFLNKELDKWIQR
jgi:hypothetical protein